MTPSMNTSGGAPAERARRQRRQRQRAAFAVVVGAQQDEHVFDRDDDDQRPQDQREHAEHDLARDRAGFAAAPPLRETHRAGWCRCRHRRRRRCRASSARMLGWADARLGRPRGPQPRLRVHVRDIVHGGRVGPAAPQRRGGLISLRSLRTTCPCRQQFRKWALTSG